MKMEYFDSENVDTYVYLENVSIVNIIVIIQEIKGKY